MPGTFAYTVATNTVVVTAGTAGAPADFASFVAADRAAAASLLAAWAPISNTKALTYQVRPVELLALLISFVVAEKTAETDYIYVTGTDWLGAALTKALDVSAGNGIYTTDVYFRTITNIDCSDNAAGGGTVWADGTVAVTQPIWGVIWNKGNGQLQLDCLTVVGNGSTSTWFQDYEKQIVFTYLPGTWTNYWNKTANATAILGQCDDETNKTVSRGCTLFATAAFNGLFSFTYIYDCNIKAISSKQLLVFNTRLWGSVLSGKSGNLCGANLVYFYSVLANSYVAGTINNGETAADFILANRSSVNLPQAYGLATLKRVTVINSSLTPTNRSTLTMIDSIMINSTVVCSTYWGANVNFKASINIHLTDQNDNPIQGAVVNLYDMDGTPVWTEGTVTTGVDGKISEQYATYIRYWATGTVDAGDGVTYNETRTPHTLSITKAGYQDYPDVITINRKMDLELAMLAVVDQWPQCPIEKALESAVYSDPANQLTGVYHEADPIEVQKDVLFGPNQSYVGELTGGGGGVFPIIGGSHIIQPARVA